VAVWYVITRRHTRGDDNANDNGGKIVVCEGGT